MDWSVIKSFTIPEGSVKRVTCNGVVLWEKNTGDYTSWDDVQNKPFNTIDTTSGIKIEGESLKLDVVNSTQQYDYRPITSHGVYEIVGEIKNTGDYIDITPSDEEKFPTDLTSWIYYKTTGNEPVATTTPITEMLSFRPENIMMGNDRSGGKRCIYSSTYSTAVAIPARGQRSGVVVQNEANAVGFGINTTSDSIPKDVEILYPAAAGINAPNWKSVKRVSDGRCGYYSAEQDKFIAVKDMMIGDYKMVLPSNISVCPKELIGWKYYVTNNETPEASSPLTNMKCFRISDLLNFGDRNPESRTIYSPSYHTSVGLPGTSSRNGYILHGREGATSSVNVPTIGIGASSILDGIEILYPANLTASDASNWTSVKQLSTDKYGYYDTVNNKFIAVLDMTE